ncbi:MAG: hypothetical protein ACI9VR_004901 [Cognaticolwellia sp.]|jgi:hypothetical protein
MLWHLLACGPSGPTVLPSEVVFSGEGRLEHTRTGPAWSDANVDVGAVTWVRGQSKVQAGVLQPGRTAPDEIAAYLPGSTAQVMVRMDGEVPTGAWITLTGAWDSGAPFASQRLPLAPQVSWSLQVPERLDKLSLTLTYQLPDVGPYQSEHILVTTWDKPLQGTPLYRRPLLWMAEWGAGTPARSVIPLELQDAAENELALKALRGLYQLGIDEGRTYGSFPRPKEKDNQAHVFLDHPQCACGEYRGILLNLIEEQGIDGNWVLMAFRNPSLDALSMYETREIAAVGTEPKVWQHWNHVAVEVNGQVYDPTYNLHHPDFPSYEDDLFERYCYGEEEKCKTPGGWCQQPRPEGTCIDNPPGFDPDGPEGAMLVKRGDKY